ncbi:hypothetical protein [Aquimarina algiphila]|nr:hypothetical protein [Aquimarina algiphila]
MKSIGQVKQDYIPFVEEWEKEVMKLPKKVIVSLLRDALKNKELDL